MGKKFNGLYNRVFEALHEGEGFVLVCDRNSAEMEKLLADALGDFFLQHKGETITTEEIAHFSMMTLSCPDDIDDLVGGLS